MRNTLLIDALCLSLGEAHCGTCTSIQIRACGRSVQISDNGIGLSLEKDKQGMPFAKWIFSTLWACRDHKAHQELGLQLCGVGMVVVNAFSESLVISIHCGGMIHQQSYHLGVADAPFQVVGQTDRTGTDISFTIAEEFAGAEDFDLEAVRVAIFAKKVDLSKATITLTGVLAEA